MFQASWSNSSTFLFSAPSDNNQITNNPILKLSHKLMQNDRGVSASGSCPRASSGNEQTKISSSRGLVFPSGTPDCDQPAHALSIKQFRPWVRAIWGFGYCRKGSDNGEMKYSNQSMCTSANRHPLQGTSF